MGVMSKLRPDESARRDAVQARARDLVYVQSIHEFSKALRRKFPTSGQIFQESVGIAKARAAQQGLYGLRNNLEIVGDRLRCTWDSRSTCSSFYEYSRTR